MQIQPWFKCKCGKLHTADYVLPNSICKCGEKLMPQIPIINVRGTIDNKSL